MDTCVLLSNSSISTSLVFLSQLTTHLTANNNYKVVTINSKESRTMRSTLKAIVKGITGDADSNVQAIENFQKDQLIDLDDFDDFNDDEEDEDEIKTFDRRHPWDLDIAQEWCDLVWKKNGNNIHTSQLRIVLVIEDIESFNLSLLNALLRLLHSYSDRLPLKLIFNVGTNIKTFSQKLSHDVLHMMTFHRFNIEQTDQIINRVVSDLVVPDTLLLDEELAGFILRRFKGSVKNVGDFMNTITYANMTHFFANPLSIIPFLGEEQLMELPTPYLNALRTLPSFRKYISSLVDSANDNSKLKSLLQSDDATRQLLIKSIKSFKIYTHCLKSVFWLFTEVIGKRTFRTGMTHLEIYCKLTSRDSLISKQLVSELLLKLDSITVEDLKDIFAEIEQESHDNDFLHGLFFKLKTHVDFNSLDGFRGSSYAEKMNFKIESRKLVKLFISILSDFLKSNIENPYHITFHELFTLSDVDVVKQNLVPSTKNDIMEALINPEAYLEGSCTGHEVLDRLNNSMEPVISTMFTIYRETTLDLNIYDYYAVFKSSLPKDEIMRDLELILDDESNILESYLSDELRFKYIYQFFNDKNIPTELKWDKLTLTFFLQKCEELVYCGFFKQKLHAKKKAGSLEKAVWKDV